MKKTYKREQFKLTFTEEGDQFDVNQLVDFLQYLKGTYALALKDSRFSSITEIDDVESRVFLAERYVDLLNPSDRQLKQRYKEDLAENELQILTIRKESPLTIVFTGISLAFSLAAIFSGGKFKSKIGPVEMEFEINSLGEGISKIQEALSKRDDRVEVKQIRLEERRKRELGSSDRDIEIIKDALNVPGLDSETIVRLKKEIEKLERRRGNNRGGRGR